MAIKVSGTIVIDNERNANAGIVTATALNVNPTPITFSPTDGATNVAVDSNIVITYNASISKGSGNITLRDGSASGSVIETIAVSSGTVSLSGAQVTINPSSNFSTGKDIYVVIDEGAFVQSNTDLSGSSVLLDTYNFSTGPITVSSFSPSDGATNVAIDSNIVITFSENITKETTAATKYITLRAGSASGTVRQTIDVSTSAVSVSGTQATINPPSDLEYEEDTYVVVDEKSFFNSSGIDASGNAVINTYNFTAAQNLNIPPLGGCDATIGGYLICCSSSNLWVIGPNSTEVKRTWYCRGDAILTANANHACNDWFIPSLSQLKNPGYQCRTHWDKNFQFGNVKYWSNTPHPSSDTYACYQHLRHNFDGTGDKADQCCVRAFRCVSY